MLSDSDELTSGILVLLGRRVGNVLKQELKFETRYSCLRGKLRLGNNANSETLPRGPPTSPWAI